MDIIERYIQLNNSFKNKLIHHFGTGQGFFSELNSLLFSVLYCLRNKLKIELYSKDASFCFGNGWSEYFELFCPEYKNDLIGKRISRGYYNLNKGDKYLFLYKTITKNLLSSDIYWYCRTSWFEHSHFNIPELGINGDIRHALKAIIPIVYRFNPTYKTIIQEEIVKVGLPEKYISLHIRAGDKISERQLITPQKYLEKTKMVSKCKHLFVSTDDYRVFELLKKKNPDYYFYTTTSPNEQGYDQAKFVLSSEEYIRKNLIEMFASIQIILNSEHFIGTYSSNPGMFLGMLLDEKMTGMDFNRWLII